MIKKVILNSFILTNLNIVSIIFSYGVYKIIFSTYKQGPLQAGVALLITCIGFITWGYILAKYGKKIFIGRKYHLAWIFLLSFLWTPVIYVPLHYITQGYLTSGDNLLSIWLFQVPTNLLVLYIYYKILIQRAFI